MSLLSCPFDSSGIRNAPAVALVYWEPETGELQAGRWTFKHFLLIESKPALWVERTRG